MGTNKPPGDSLSAKAVDGVSCCFLRPKMFSPGDRVWYHSRTLGAYVLAQQHLCCMKHIGRASMQKSLHLCRLCLHQWRVPQFALKYPCNPAPRDRHLATVSPSPWETVPWVQTTHKNVSTTLMSLTGKFATKPMSDVAALQWVPNSIRSQTNTAPTPAALQTRP